MSGSLGYENVKSTVRLAGALVSTSIVLFKKVRKVNFSQVVAEIKDSQPDEILDCVTNDARAACLDVIAAFKAE